MSSMRIARWFACAVLASLLAGCGGGGGGGGDSTSISLSRSSMTFSGEQNSAAPADQTLTVTFKGDGVLIGTLPGQTLPSWLGVAQDSQPAGGQVSVRVSVNQAGLATGSYTSTIRFVTGHTDGSDVKSSDLSITLTVTEPFGATSAPLNFTEIDGDPAGAQPTAGIATQIKGDNVSWRASADQPWISLSATSGTVKGTVTVHVARQSLGLGTYNGNVTINDDRSGRHTVLPVSYVIRAAQLATDQSNLAFNITPASTPNALSASLRVSDEINGVNPAKGAAWTATTDQPWLTLSATSGQSAPGTTLTVGVSASDIALLASNAYSAHVNFSYTDSAGANNSLQVPVVLTLRMPLARAATPYLIEPATATTVLVRGEDMQPADLPLLRIDGAPLGTAPTFVNATSVSLSLPALSAGRHILSFTTGIGLARSAAEVTAKTVVTPTSGNIVSAHRKRLVYDVERARLYAVDRDDGEIERYDWNGTTWTPLTPLAVPGVVDAALTRSGRELVIITPNEILTTDATDANATPVTVVSSDTLANTQNYDRLNYIGVLDSGLAVIAQTFLGSGHTTLLGFDTVRRQMLTAAPIGAIYYEGHLGVSDDGHYALVGGVGLSPAAEAGIVDSRGSATNVFGTQQSYPEGNRYAFDLGRDGSRVLDTFIFVRDIAGQIQGQLPNNEFAKLSPDGNRAYVFNQSTAPGQLDIYDLTSTPYAKVGQVALPARVVDPMMSLYAYPNEQYWLSAVITPDGKAMIFAGPERIVVVPLP